MMLNSLEPLLNRRLPELPKGCFFAIWRNISQPTSSLFPRTIKNNDDKILAGWAFQVVLHYPIFGRGYWWRSSWTRLGPSAWCWGKRIDLDDSVWKTPIGQKGFVGLGDAGLYGGLNFWPMPILLIHAPDGRKKIIGSNNAGSVYSLRWRPSTLGVNNSVGHSERWEGFRRDGISGEFVVELWWFKLLHISQVFEVHRRKVGGIDYLLWPSASRLCSTLRQLQESITARIVSVLSLWLIHWRRH